MEVVIWATITARVGRGGKQHAYHASVAWQAERTISVGPRAGQVVPAGVSVYTGQVYCGSQRAMSGSYPTGLNSDGVTCERCLARPARADREWDSGNRHIVEVADATRAITIDRRGNLAATPWAIAMVTPS